MKRILLQRRPRNAGFASRQRFHDTVFFSQELGFEPVIVSNTLHMIRYLLMNLFRNQIVLIIYPHIFRPLKSKFRWIELLLFKLYFIRKTVIAYITDLPILQHYAFLDIPVKDPVAMKIEKFFFRSIDQFCVFNENMHHEISQRHGISEEKFTYFEMLEFHLPEIPFNISKSLSSPVKVIYGGQLEKAQMEDIIKSLRTESEIGFELFGSNGDWIRREKLSNVEFKGSLPLDEFVSYMSMHANFGLIARKIDNLRLVHYANMGSSSKFSAYIRSQTPIFCISQFSYISKLLAKYKIGYSIDNYHEILDIILNTSEDEYQQMIANLKILAQKINAGYFFKRAITECMRKLS